MHFDGVDEDFEPRKRRRCRTSKKKRLRLKQRASLEPNESEPESHQSENKQQLATETRKESENQDKEPSQAHENKPPRQQEDSEQVVDEREPEGEHGDSDGDGEEMTEYERKRRANILRNQAYLEQVGFSSAKLAVRTAAYDKPVKEAAEEVKRQKTEERQAQRAAQLAAQEERPVRKSRRLQRATEETTRRESRRKQREMEEHASSSVQLQSLRRFADNARSRRLRQRNSRKLTSMRLQEENQSSDGDEGEVVELVSDSSTEAEDMKSSEDPGVMEKDEVKASTHEFVNDDSLLEAQAQPLVESKTQCSSDLPARPQQMEMADFERQRRANILRNQAFMQQVGVSIAKLAARTSIGDEAGKEAKRRELAAKRELKAARKRELSSRPVRKSRRTSVRQVVLGHPSALDYSLQLLSMREHARNRSNVHYMDVIDDDGQAFLKEMAGNPKEPSGLEINLIDAEVDYSLSTDDMTKVLPFRTTAMAFLPRADHILVACGDKVGHVSLCSPSESENARSRVVFYRPHVSHVSELIFPDSSTLISSSVEGTVRELDLHTTKSSLLCDIKDDTGISSLIASSNPQFYYAGCINGTMRLIDRRAGSLHRLSYELHERRINTLDQHPSLDHCLVTASDDRTVCLWDKRKISSHLSIPLATIPHATSVDCAHFSPRDGNWLVTVTNQESHVNIFDTSVLTNHKESDPLPIPIPTPARAYHKGFSEQDATYMHAAWDPKKTDRFVIGCVGSPSSIKIFSAHRPPRELTSPNLTAAHPVNIFHPYVDLIASGSMCGRISLWRGNTKEK